MFMKQKFNAGRELAVQAVIIVETPAKSLQCRLKSWRRSKWRACNAGCNLGENPSEELTTQAVFKANEVGRLVK